MGLSGRSLAVIPKWTVLPTLTRPDPQGQFFSETQGRLTHQQGGKSHAQVYMQMNVSKVAAQALTPDAATMRTGLMARKQRHQDGRSALPARYRLVADSLRSWLV